MHGAPQPRRGSSCGTGGSLPLRVVAPPHPTASPAAPQIGVRVDKSGCVVVDDALLAKQQLPEKKATTRSSTARVRKLYSSEEAQRLEASDVRSQTLRRARGGPVRAVRHHIARRVGSLASEVSEEAAGAAAGAARVVALAALAALATGAAGAAAGAAGAVALAASAVAVAAATAGVGMAGVVCCLVTSRSALVGSASVPATC